ncbi:MAG: helix-turn-helix transcriptional regulator [Thermodesulfobacteriota bacterium]
MAKEATFGQFFRKMRERHRLSLRRFCVENNVDPGNISKLERGLLPPPQSREKLEEYAAYLQIKEGSDDWYEFFDLASAQSGKIPQDLLNDEDLVKKLPLVFRTIRGQKISAEKLDELAEVIKKS